MNLKIFTKIFKLKIKQNEKNKKNKKFTKLKVI